jgi:site-specific recombinase XerD
MAVVQRWIDVYRAAGISRGPLFCTLGGDFISANAVRQMMQRAAERAGLERRVHPHGLRHTMSAEWVREGRPMALLRDQLGHSSLAVTDRYLRDIAHVGRAAVITSMTVIGLSTRAVSGGGLQEFRTALRLSG